MPEPETPVTATSLSRGMSTVDPLQVVLARADDADDVDGRARAIERAAGAARRPAPDGASGALPGASASARPVGVSSFAIASGGPSPTTRPPSSPASGPRSRIQSAARATSMLCSTTTTEWPASTRRCMAPDEHGHVRGVQAGRRLVEQVEPPRRRARLGQRPRELEPLRLAARERRRRLRERQVAEAEVEHGLERRADAGRVPEEPQRRRSRAGRARPRSRGPGSAPRAPRAGSGGRRRPRTSRTRRAGTASRPSRSPRPRRPGRRPAAELNEKAVGLRPRSRASGVFANTLRSGSSTPM